VLETPFQRHGRIFENYTYCYPVISRRSGGLSIGINLSRRKECNFDCPYCQVDRKEISLEPRSIDLSLVKKELLALVGDSISKELFFHPRFEGTSESYKLLRDISLSGDGEPTTSKYFSAVADLVMEICTNYKDKGITIKPVVITNGSMLHKESIRVVLKNMVKLGGGPWIKLDASTETEFSKVAESKIPYNTILENILIYSKEDPAILQMILYLDENKVESFHSNSMVERLLELQNKGANFQFIQLYTLSRKTRIGDLSPVSKERLEEVAKILHEKTNISVGIYP
jgi:wyosine [tRNA(Phe)-imidazoG37] synthetase (radical SAM superfamily)